MSIEIFIILTIAISVITSFTCCFIYNTVHKTVHKEEKAPSATWQDEAEILADRIRDLSDRVRSLEKNKDNQSSQTLEKENANKTPASTGRKPPVSTYGKNKDSNGADKQNGSNAQKNDGKQNDGKKIERPLNIEYTYLTVSDKKLSEALMGQASYYRAWRFKEKVLFEFSSEKTLKAINNRNAIIEPFCEKDPSSVPADQASNIEICKPGILNDDYTVNTKSIIKFV